MSCADAFVIAGLYAAATIALLVAFALVAAALLKLIDWVMRR